MAMEKERKVPNNLSLTVRQTQALTKEGRRLGISTAEVARRILDDWLEKRPTLANKLYGEPAR